MELPFGYTREKPIVTDYVNAVQVSTYNYFAHSVVVFNNSGGNIYVECFDNPTSTLTTSLAGSNVPTYAFLVTTGNVGTLQTSQWKTGLYVRLATTPSTGGALGTIAGATAGKITAEGVHWPMSNA